jgi:hypothetical protein
MSFARDEFFVRLKGMSIKVDVDDAVLAKAEEFARTQNTSIAGLINKYLQEIASPQDRREEARRRLLDLSAKLEGEVGERTWTRDSLYAR